MKFEHLVVAALTVAAVFTVACNRPGEPAADKSAPAAAPVAAAPAPEPPPAEPPAAPAPRKAAPRRIGSDTVAARPAAAALPSEAPAPPPVRKLTVPEGATVRVRTTTAITTKTAQTGEPFTGHLAEPLMAGNTVVAPKGAQVDGKVVESDPGGRVSGLARLTVRLTALHLDGRTVPVSTATVAREATTSKKKDAAKVGIGAGIGAAIGAIAGGGRGAAIGAGAGAGAGTATVLATRGDAAVIPAESVLTFTLSEPVTVTK
jgi:hypothetical protein